MFQLFKAGVTELVLKPIFGNEMRTSQIILGVVVGCAGSYLFLSNATLMGVYLMFCIARFAPTPGHERRKIRDSAVALCIFGGIDLLNKSHEWELSHREKLVWHFFVAPLGIIIWGALTQYLDHQEDLRNLHLQRGALEDEPAFMKLRND